MPDVRALMVQGTSSWAGKSLIATAICRHLARQGIRVAPFKAQNMSNNARVVEGGEIGVAQYLQALAARTVPDVRMNPVLVKPEGMTRSQVVVSGQPDREVSALPWPQRAPHVWPAILESLQSLLADYDVVVLEGAGSPAEINLMDFDVTNGRAATTADASVLLVADIDRGGAFAHLYGTWALLPHEARQRLRGFILNKFRGDASLLAPAPEHLSAMTGVPVIGVVPWFRHELPDEDGAAKPEKGDGAASIVAVIRYPFASNLDEFKVLEQVAVVRWARTPADLDGADLVVLPGSKHVASDLTWLRSSGLDRAVHARARAGARVLGVCGGLQMLGVRLYDPYGVDGAGEGLGLLSVETSFEREKVTRRGTYRFASTLASPWTELANKEVHGYEIRHGHTRPLPAARVAMPDGLGWVEGSVLGVTVHGLVESWDVLRALFGRVPLYSLDSTLDRLTDVVMANVDARFIEELVGLR
ncbi:MAG TPA: cobyric acid synthase [Candidatus Dormibacteraeota bacterium]|jgi:adenosylcobyric acid synthase